MDRSSEERSRFEKWVRENAPGFRLDRASGDPSGHAPDYIDGDTENCWVGWRAALEDRQEAAHVISGKDADAFIDAMKLNTPPSPERLEYLSRCAKESIAAESRVPSEATPTKENAPLGSESCTPCPKCGAVYVRIFCRTCGEDLDVPAPEVQGTPTKSNVAHQPWCASAPRPMDVPMGRGPYPCDCGTVKAAPAPEVQGTPTNEKEWRKLAVGQWFFMDSPECTDRYSVMERTGGGNSIVCSTPYHHEGAANDMKEIARLHNESPVPVGTPQKETPPSISAESSSPLQLAEEKRVPEGVQGKEPQTFEEYWEIGRPDIRHLSSIQQIKLAEVRSAFSAGEAAGRRSAITEIQEWAISEGLRDRNYVIEKCRELQEKTKP